MWIISLQKNKNEKSLFFCVTKKQEQNDQTCCLDKSGLKIRK